MHDVPFSYPISNRVWALRFPIRYAMINKELCTYVLVIRESGQMKANEVSVRISSMKKLKMVNCYSLFGEEGPIYGILAYYQDRLINLCNADEHFGELFDRIVLLYDSESKETEIIADEETKRILGQANAFGEERYEGLLSGFEEIAAPIVLPKAFSHVYVQPIVRYVMKILYEGQGDELTFEDRQNTWFGKGTMEGMFHGKRQRFPYQITSGFGESYDVTVHHFYTNGNDLKFVFTYGFDGITVMYHDRYFGYEGKLLFQMQGNKADFSHILREREEVKLNVEKECEARRDAQPSVLIRRLIPKEEGTSWEAYELPWGGFAFRNTYGTEEYRVLSSSEDDMTVSHVACYSVLSAKDMGHLPFGRFYIRLYERNDITELHLLDMEYPRSGKYQEQYAGRYYTLGTGKDK